MLAKTVHPFVRAANLDCFKSYKTVDIHEFPDGVEVFINENRETCSDGSLFEPVEKSERGEGDREANKNRAARRARTQVRRRCKAIQADSMLTGTYRENMQDLARLQRDIKALVKRLRELGPFEYVLCVERQKRGAYHFHMACQSFPAFMKNKDGVKVKSYNLIRSIWRSIVGQDNGNIDLTRPRSNGRHRIASYIAKYVGKALEDAELNAKSYWSSKGIVMPKPVRLWFDGATDSWDLVSLVMGDLVQRGFTDIAQYADRMREFLWFSAAKPR